MANFISETDERKRAESSFSNASQDKGEKKKKKNNSVSNKYVEW